MSDSGPTPRPEMTDTSIELASWLLARMPADPHAEAHRDALVAAMGWKCVATGCARQSRSTALCDTHYRQFRNVRGAA